MRLSFLFVLVGCSGDVTSATTTVVPSPLPTLDLAGSSFTLDPCATSGELDLKLPAAYTGQSVVVSAGDFVGEREVESDGRLSVSVGLATSGHLCGADFATAAFDSVSGDCQALAVTVVAGDDEATADLQADTAGSSRVAYTADGDGDGFVADGALERWACEPLAGSLETAMVAPDVDCDDTDAQVFPGAVERCSGVDENCDGLLDDGAPGYRVGSVGTRAAVLALDSLVDDDLVEICGAVEVNGSLVASDVRFERIASTAHLVGRVEVASSGSLVVEAVPWTPAADGDGAFARVEGSLAVLGEPLSPLVLACTATTATAHGGAFVVDAGALELADVTVEDCLADEGGAIHATTGAVVNLLDSRFVRNRATGDGGALHQQGGRLQIGWSSLEGNAAGGSGGAIWADVEGSLTTVTLHNNDALVDGGALWLEGRAGLEVFACDVSTNIAGARGGGAVLGGDVTVVGGSFSDNTASEQAGAILADVDGGLAGESSFPLVLSGNTAPLGGAVVLTRGTLTGPVTFDDNSADRGGALVLTQVTSTPLDVVLPDLTFTNNIATQNGGAVSVAATATLATIDVQRATFLGNTALSGAAWHQPIDAALTFDATASTNLATGSGGVLFASSASRVTLSGSYTGNEADKGAVFAASVGLVDLDGDGLTITGNEATNGGILETGGTVGLTGLQAWSNVGTAVLSTPGTASVTCTGCVFEGPAGESTLTAIDYGGVASTVGAGTWDVTCDAGLACAYVAAP